MEYHAQALQSFNELMNKLKEIDTKKACIVFGMYFKILYRKESDIPAL